LDSRKVIFDSAKKKWNQLKIEKTGDDKAQTTFSDLLWARTEIRYKQLIIEMYNKLCQVYDKEFIGESFVGDPLDNKDLILKRYNKIDFNWIREKAITIRERIREKAITIQERRDITRDITGLEERVAKLEQIVLVLFAMGAMHIFVPLIYRCCRA
jgi:hypothetical protein